MTQKEYEKQKKQVEAFEKKLKKAFPADMSYAYENFEKYIHKKEFAVLKKLIYGNK